MTQVAKADAKLLAAKEEIRRVVKVAERALRIEFGPFVFRCPRCAQTERLARIMITPLGEVMAVQHELPVCDAFYEVPPSRPLAPLMLVPPPPPDPPDQDGGPNGNASNGS